jgi:hypothetical protein
MISNISKRKISSPKTEKSPKKHQTVSIKKRNINDSSIIDLTDGLEVENNFKIKKFEDNTETPKTLLLQIQDNKQIDNLPLPHTESNVFQLFPLVKFLFYDWNSSKNKNVRRLFIFFLSNFIFMKELIFF